jgi:hypothetical protein
MRSEPRRSSGRNLFVRANAVLLAFASAFHAFDARLFSIRATAAVHVDSLFHYYMLMAWWQHGDSPRGFTLTPSPAFIDMLVEFPLMLLAPDFERWSYALACSYTVLIFVALFLVLRFVLPATALFAAVVAGVTLAGFYRLAPYNFVVHTFVVAHTSEIFTTLGLIALVRGWFRHDARQRGYAPHVYVAVVAVCVMSSPFFIATYCIPAVVAALAILGTESLSMRRFAWFCALTTIGALIGLLSLALISRYVWPVRGDYYGDPWKAYQTFKHALFREPGGVRFAWATLVAMLASSALVVVGRRIGKWSRSTVFLLAFFPACTVCCVVLPIKRGGFYGPYEFRYITLPALCTLAFYVTAGARLALAFTTVLRRRLPRLVLPSWLPWTAGVLGLLALAISTTFRGPLTMEDDASVTARMLRCFRDAEQHQGLQDGLGQWQLARHMNAARYAADWRSPYVVVQLQPSDFPQIDPRHNNLRWFDGTYRQGAAKLNFLVTNAMSDQVLAFFRDHIGAPDRTIACPLPSYYGTGRPGFDLWVWDREDAQRRLEDLVMHDNLRSPFSPVIGADRMAIDVEWGMRAHPSTSHLEAGRRIWQGPGPGNDDLVVEINPMYLPSGRYRLELELSATATSSTEPIAEFRVRQDHRGEISRSSIATGDDHPSVTFDIDNRGGPTSGAAVVIDVVASAARSIEISGATLTMLEQSGVSPFGIFR